MIQSLFRSVSLISAFLFLIGCGSTGELQIKEFEDGEEIVQLQYRGAESPLNLVKEVRFYETGVKKRVTPLDNGKVNGVVEYYRPTGYLRETITFRDGVQEGPYKSYDSEGLLVFEGIMSEGMKQGKWTSWYDEVQRSEERTYLDDQLHGSWTFWYIDGTVKRVEVYEHGALTEQTEY